MENQEIPLIPVRMLNEFVYCPRLAYLEWVQGEFLPNADTVEGKIRHKRVDVGNHYLPEPDAVSEDRFHARSVRLGSSLLGITAVIDIVEGEGNVVTPVDYKRGKRPHIAGGVYAPERVQLCAQALLLREHGFECQRGFIYFSGSKERIPVEMTEELIAETTHAIEGLRCLVKETAALPQPLEDSPKCPRCSLGPICLPDEIKFLKTHQGEIRPIFAMKETAYPFYVQKAGAFVKKEGEQFIVEYEKEKVATARITEVSQVVLFGHAMMSTPAMHECFRREIPITFCSYGGWFLGHTVGVGHRNAEIREFQYRTSFDATKCLQIARSIVAAKILNCRTLLRRNWKVRNDKDINIPQELLRLMKADAENAKSAGSIESLLGIEGAAANRYFQNFNRMIAEKEEGVCAFDFSGRNRRPPKDPVNAMLSLAYAMLGREWTIALSAVGLDPYRGFYHRPRFGRPALALDMMEAFRPLVADSTVVTAVNTCVVRENDFISAAGSCNLTDEGRKRFIGVFENRMAQEITHPLFGYQISYRQLLEVQSRLLIRYLAGEIPDYPHFLTR